MSWEAKAHFLGLLWETVSRTSPGKFLRIESCYPESFGFLRLCSAVHWSQSKGIATYFFYLDLQKGQVWGIVLGHNLGFNLATAMNFATERSLKI